MAASLTVVIVNYRTAGLVIDCLRSLQPEVAALAGARVVVVENASGDDSLERIAGAVAAAGWGSWVEVVAAPRNGGFSAGNNVGLRPALLAPAPPDWFLLLNPDTYVHPGALRALLERGESGPRIGIVGSRLEDPDGTLQPSTFRFHCVLGELERALRLGLASRALARWATVRPSDSGASRVDWVSGASMLVRREVLQEVGLLDEGYFLYYEEVDLCLRSARAGWECWYEPRSRVVHLVGRATGIDPSNVARQTPTYVYESRRRFFVKSFGLAYTALADLAWIAGHLAWRLRMWLQGRPRGSAPGQLRAFIRHSALARGGLR